MGGCSAVNCTNSNKKGFRIFRFPKDPQRCKRWAVNCRRGGKWMATTSMGLCEMHFEDSQFENKRADGRKLLKWNAIPTLFNFPNQPKQLDARRISVLKKAREIIQNISEISPNPKNSCIKSNSIHEHISDSNNKDTTGMEVFPDSKNSWAPIDHFSLESNSIHEHISDNHNHNTTEMEFGHEAVFMKYKN